jgi:cell division septum initiation protein DivIVA
MTATLIIDMLRRDLDKALAKINELEQELTALKKEIPNDSN